MAAPAVLNRLLAKIALYDDPVAYRELFLLYHQRLLRFSATITHSTETAEEVVSDVFLKLWINRSLLTRIENFHLYVYISTKNLSINQHLKTRKTTTFSLDETLVDMRNLQPDPEQLMITNEMAKRLQRAINDLPPKCRLIFKLIKEDGLKYKDVAELLELSVKTIENQMTIALKRIGESIQFSLSKK